MVSRQGWKIYAREWGSKALQTDPMRIGLEIINGIFGFIEHWKELCQDDITKHVWYTHEPLISHWDRICLALMILGIDIHTTLIQRFWPQNQLTIADSDTIFFNNGDICEWFAMDKHNDGPTFNCPALSFCVDVVCYKG